MANGRLLDEKAGFGKRESHVSPGAIGASKLIIPSVLLNGKLPDNAVYELERHMEYIINKYSLIE